MKDILSLLQIQDFLWLSGVSAVGITTIIQAFSKRYSPWTYILQQIGRGLNAEVLNKLDEHEKKINELIEEDKKHDEALAQKNACDARRRILRFADEIRQEINHSEEYFDNILEDIKEYSDYCNTHPKFKNDKAVISIEVIEEVYKECFKKNNFNLIRSQHG